jgi:sugar (pentulose or hexulose) kinase
MADVMNCPVLRIQVSKSAALGAALRAAHGWLVESGQKADWEKVVSVFTAPDEKNAIKPNAKAARVYDKLIETYAKYEQETLRQIS